jgi:uncharacterized membrane protein YccF (DUF307 family)
MTASSAPVIVDRPAPNIILRVIWFILVGWWLGGVLSAVAWALNATIIGMPFGLWLINRLPTFITLRAQEQRFEVVGGDLVPLTQQRSFLVRALYFVFIGWWFSGIWMGLAYLLVLSIVGIPLAFWMYGRVGAVTTLYRS